MEPARVRVFISHVLSIHEGGIEVMMRVLRVFKVARVA
jgi:hypothetical protein